MTEPHASWDELWEGFRHSTLLASQEIDLGVGPFQFVELRLALESRQASVAANYLLEFEREARRAAKLLGRPEFAWRRGRGGFPIPLPRREGGLAIERTDEGSLEWVLSPYGLFHTVASSELVQVVSTTSWLLGGGAKITGWLRRSHSSTAERQPLPEITVLELPDGARVRIPRGGRMTVRAQGPEGEIELIVEFGPQ